MLGLCSCYDLSDFLSNLLQQFASDENEVGRISMQSFPPEEELPGELGGMHTLSLPADTDLRPIRQPRQQLHAASGLGAALRALTDKIVAARVLFRKMIVAEVGSREPGRYGGLSIYFPDPNMAVSCIPCSTQCSWPLLIIASLPANPHVGFPIYCEFEVWGTTLH